MTPSATTTPMAVSDEARPPGDLVARRIEARGAVGGDGEPGPTDDGPFER